VHPAGCGRLGLGTNQTTDENDITDQEGRPA
jgi:hypothetical protein